MRTARICVRSLRILVRFPFRTLLASLSACFGVATAICSVDYALGGRQKLLEQFDRLGANVLIVTPKQSRTVAGRARTGSIVQTLVSADAAAIQRENPAILKMSATFSRAYLVKAGDLAKNNSVVVGADPAFFSIKHWSVGQGEMFKPEQARVALLGSSIARELLGDSPVGSRIFINRVPFVVAGVLAERGQGLDAANEDSQVYVPLSTAMHRLANAEYYSSILLEVRSPADLDATASAVQLVLRKRHRGFAKLGDDFDVQNQKQLIETQLAVSSRLYSYARWIGAGALAISGLGALAISWISVRERTPEIGTRRALGATRLDIFIQFLFEAMLPAAAGCLLGSVAAKQGTIALSRFASQPAVFAPETAAIAFAAAIGLNAVFAVLPARAAASLDPIAALHFE